MLRRLRPPSTRLFSSSAPSKQQYDHADVVVVGGGPAGLALAGALGSSRVVRQNLKIALVEAGDLSKIRNWHLPPDKYSNRVSSLTNASYAFLRDIGAWNYVQEDRTCPIEHMDVWDGVSDARISFNASDMGATVENEGMARLTENLNLQRGLLRLLQDVPAVELIQCTKVMSIARDSEEQGGWPVVTLDNGRRLRARLLVGADGFNSPVRAYAQIPSFGWSYDTQAIVATLIHRPRTSYEGLNTTAYQRFLPSGPIAFLPLAPNISSVVWSTKPHIARALQASDPVVFASMINAAFRLPSLSLEYLYNRMVQAQASGTSLTPHQILEEISWREQSHTIDPHSALSSVRAFQNVNAPAMIPPEGSEALPPLVTAIQEGTIASFPLRFNHTESYLGEGAGRRTVLVGDAAHTTHPLAGQGLNLGLGDVECLAKCIENAILRGGDIGLSTALQPYARKRYLVNHTMMSAVDKLHKLYTTEVSSVVWARSVGLEVVNELDLFKTAIMMTAGGNGRGSGMVSGWDMAAQGVEALSTAGRIARSAGVGIGSIVGHTVQNLIKGVAGGQRP